MQSPDEEFRQVIQGYEEEDVEQCSGDGPKHQRTWDHSSCSLETTEIVTMRQKDAKTASEEETPRIGPSYCSWGECRQGKPEAFPENRFPAF